MNFPLVWLAIAIIGLIGVIFDIMRRRKKKCATDYRGFFIIGIIWVLFGISFYIRDGSLAFLGMGIVFLIVGLANKDKWKKQKPLSSWRRNILIGLVILTALLLLAAFLLKFLR